MDNKMLKLSELTLLLLFCLSFASCKSNQKNGYGRSEENLKSELITYSDSLFTSDSSHYKVAQVEIKVDYPLGNSLVCNFIREWINDELYRYVYHSNKEEGKVVDIEDSILKKGEDFINFCGSALLNNYQNETSSGETTINISKIYETIDIVTYQIDVYIYSAGAAHGINPLRGVTFRKSDGRRFDSNMIYEIPLDVLKKGLQSFFGDEINIYDACISDAVSEYSIDMPATDPYFTKDGLLLIYQQYEIAPYVYGHPQFVIPYSEVKKYLSPSAKSFCKI